MTTTATFTVSTDLLDYAPGSTAYVSATEVDLGATIEFQISHVIDAGADGVWGTLDDVLGDNSGGGHTPWVATDGGAGDLDGIVNGVIQTSWYVDPDDSLGATFLLTATDAGADETFGTDDDEVASASFTDNVSTDYRGWENIVSAGVEWANGGINAGQGLYLEGDVVPHAVSFTGLTVNTQYSFIISFDYFQESSNSGGFVVIDSYNKSLQNILLFPAGSGGPISDPTVMPDTDGLFYISTNGVDGIDADVTSVSTSMVVSTTEKQATVVFTALDTSATFYYGLRLALPGEVLVPAGVEPNTDPTNGADGFTGLCLQSSVQNGLIGPPIGGGGNVQMAPGAVTQGSISGYKWSDLDGGGDWDAGEPGLGGWSIQLYRDDGDNAFDPGDLLVATEVTSDGTSDANGDGDVTVADLGFYQFVPVIRGTYFVREVQQSGWVQTFPGDNLAGPLTINEVTPTHVDINFGNLQQLPALDIDKSAVITPIDADGTIDSPADDIQYTIVVTNTGNVTLTNVVVTDPRSTNANDVVGTIASLAPGASQQFQFTYDVTQADIDTNGGGDGDIDNTATADSDQTTPVNDSAVVPIGQSPALAIDKSASVPGDGDGTIDSPADDIQYTIVVTNTGNVTLTNVVVTDPRSTNANDVVGTIASLAPGASQQFQFTYDVTQADIDTNGGGDGDIDNTATADSDQTTPVNDSAVVPIGQSPALAIDKSASVPGDGDGTIDSPADDIQYTIVVTNTGNVTLTNVVVTDPRSTNANDVVGTIASLAPGASQQFQFTYDVTQADIDTNGGGDGDIDNTATADSDQTTPVNDSAVVPIGQSPALMVEKTGAWVDGDGDNYADVGELINYTVAVTNTGNVTLNQLQIDDPLVTNLAYDSGDDGNDLLDVGETWTYLGSYPVTQADIDAGEVYNLATATADDPNDDEVTENDDHTEPLPQNELLSIVKTGTWVDGSVDGVLNGQADPGEAINYTFAVTNEGNVTLHDVMVTDTIGGVTVTGGPTTLDVGETDDATFAGVYYITLEDIEDGHFYNLATADSTESPQAQDDEDVFLPNPRISLVKTGTFDAGGDGYANPDEVITYTFAATNTGNLDLHDVTLIDSFLSNVTPVLGGDGYNAGDAGVKGVLEIGESWSYSGSYVVTQEDIDWGSVYNLATATAKDPGDYLVTDEDDNTETLPQNPYLEVLKTVLGIFDALDPDVADGDQIADLNDWIKYEIVVTNTGNVTLKDVDVWDRVDGHAPVRLYLSGDTNQNGINDGIEDWSANGDLNDDGELDVGEIWTYHYNYQVVQADIDLTADLAWVDEGIAATPIAADGAFFYSGTQPQATGSGLIDSFVRIQDSNSNNGVGNRRKDGVEEGYNTDYRPQQFDEDNTATFNHSIRVGDIPILTINGKQYIEFRLDTDELDSKQHPLLTLEDLRVFTTSDPDLTNFDHESEFGSAATKIFDLDTPILLNDWSTGSGHGDYAVAIPITAALDDDDYIILYSKFSGADGGFEEWYVRPQPLLVNKVSVSAETLYTEVEASGGASAAVAGNGFADLAIGKVGAVVHSGNGTIDYVITIQNTGNTTLKDVVVTDTIEGGWLRILDNSTVDGDGTPGDLGTPNGVIDVGETWTFHVTVTYGQGNIDVNGDDLLTNIVTVDTDKTHPSSNSTDVDVGALAFFGAPWALNAHSAAWWNTHKAAWDGNLKSDQYDGLLGSDLSMLDVLIAVDSNKSGTLTPSDANGILVGDINANGLTDPGETTLFVSLGTAQQILANNNPADLRHVLIKEALAAQLNINNMSGDSTATNNNEGPNNLVSEAAMWLRGLGPYTYTNSTGKVDANNDGVISESGSNNSEFNKNSGAFTSDANGGALGTNLTAFLDAWATDVDIDGIPGSVTASGEDLLHALQSFNGVTGLSNVDSDGHLVVSPAGNKVGWHDGVDVVGVVNNSADAFWGVLDAYSVI